MLKNIKVTVHTQLGYTLAFLVGCGPVTSPVSSIKTSSVNARVNVAITDSEKIYFSTELKDQVAGICMMPANATQLCVEGQSGYIATSEFTTASKERRFFTTDNRLKIDPTMQYVIVDPSKEVLQKFKFVPVNQDNQQMSLESALELIKEEVLEEELTYLASDDFNGRLSGTPENNRAADWLIEKLKELNISPMGTNGDYRQKFRVPNLGNVETANIIGVIEGQDPTLKNEYIVIGAHMDHAGTLQRGYTCSPGNIPGDSICNGADDNGSGTIGVLNIAKALSKSRHLLKRSVIIMWFSGEEEGLIGSKHFVNNPTVNLRQIVYMINLDMIGYLARNGQRLEAIGASSSKTGRAVAMEIAKKFPKIKVMYDAKAQGGSDHAPFMGKGIPAIFFNTGVSSNPNYHKTSDHADRIDYLGMERTTRIAFEQLIRISDQLPPSYSEFGLAGGDDRPPLLPEYELEKSCHHLIELEDERLAAFDFRYGNSGKAEFLQAP